MCSTPASKKQWRKKPSFSSTIPWIWTRCWAPWPICFIKILHLIFQLELDIPPQRKYKIDFHNQRKGSVHDREGLHYVSNRQGLRRSSHHHHQMDQGKANEGLCHARTAQAGSGKPSAGVLKEVWFAHSGKNGAFKEGPHR